jgi:hypothetical protein
LNGKTENIAYWVSKEYAKQGYESIIDEDKWAVIAIYFITITFDIHWVNIFINGE